MDKKYGIYLQSTDGKMKWVGVFYSPSSSGPAEDRYLVQKDKGPDFPEVWSLQDITEVLTEEGNKELLERIKKAFDSAKAEEPVPHLKVLRVVVSGDRETMEQLAEVINKNKPR